MKLQQTFGTDEMEYSLVSVLFGIKTVFGPTEVLSTIRKRPWIKDYLRDYYGKCLDYLQSDYYNSISEQNS